MDKIRAWNATQPPTSHKTTWCSFQNRRVVFFQRMTVKKTAAIFALSSAWMRLCDCQVESPLQERMRIVFLTDMACMRRLMYTICMYSWYPLRHEQFNRVVLVSDGVNCVIQGCSSFCRASRPMLQWISASRRNRTWRYSTSYAATQFKMVPIYPWTDPLASWRSEVWLGRRSYRILNSKIY